MIDRKDILSLPFLKKSPFSGSYQGMRYRLEKVSEEDKDALCVTIWDAPYCFEATDPTKKESEKFPFSQDGIDEVVAWLNEKWKSQEDRWKKALSSW